MLYLVSGLLIGVNGNSQEVNTFWIERFDSQQTYGHLSTSRRLKTSLRVVDKM